MPYAPLILIYKMNAPVSPRNACVPRPVKIEKIENADREKTPNPVIYEEKSSMEIPEDDAKSQHGVVQPFHTPNPYSVTPSPFLAIVIL